MKVRLNRAFEQFDQQAFVIFADVSAESSAEFVALLDTRHAAQAYPGAFRGQDISADLLAKIKETTDKLSQYESNCDAIRNWIVKHGWSRFETVYRLARDLQPEHLREDSAGAVYAPLDKLTPTPRGVVFN